ncbi:hypothetical protein HDU89_006642 [Geranomyces variabilis]|nr:hypothetical protein HDU89_006642 [Geranomyces variabilis]
MIRYAWNVKGWEASDEEISALLSYLPTAEQAKIKAFRFPIDGHRSLMGQILARLALLAYIPELERLSELRIGRTACGKPILISPSDRPDLGFNVSHHGDWVVVAAVAAEAECPTGVRLGVDVSEVAEPLPGECVDDFFESFQTYFTQQEWIYVNGENPSKARMHRFHHLWCLKESYVKALGLGLSMDLDRISFTVNAVQPIAAHGVYAISLAVDGEVQNDFHFELCYLDQSHPVALCYERKCSSLMQQRRPAPPQFTVLRWGGIKERISALGDSRFATAAAS